jgi:diaminopimelate epimerase
VRLTKHHGLGNDFLVAVGEPVDGELARALCARHTGIGADGLIGAVRTEPVTMHLYNADGSRAEMSGNGIRCLAQALVDAGWAAEGELAIATDAGLKVLQVEPERAPGLRWVSVDMGPAVETGPEGWVSMGNPHQVIVVDHLGPGSAPPAGSADRNVELVTPGPEPDAITMRVWERGVGETQACGTGAAAAAHVAHRLGLVGAHVTVHQPGGDAIVDLEPDTIVLTGPAQRIATILL